MVLLVFPEKGGKLFVEIAVNLEEISSLAVRKSDKSVWKGKWSYRKVEADSFSQRGTDTLWWNFDNVSSTIYKVTLSNFQVQHLTASVNPPPSSCLLSQHWTLDVKSREQRKKP